jgi:GTPase
MTFLDEAVITVRSGDGGKGSVSFRREKFEPRGGPDGGDGGKGGDVILKASGRLYTLPSDYASRKSFKAKNGEPGRSKSQSGRNGSDLVLVFPLGTLIQDHDSGEVLFDLTRDGQEVLLLPGGRGGKGNQHFATSTNRAPRFSQPGTPGQEKKLKISLKFIADIGLVGLPNAGKSTLLSRLTTAQPKIDSYPFTTLTPNLGVMEIENRPLIIADIPGLIEGASQGRGLGLRFLRHIERTKLLLHLIDITDLPEKNPLDGLFAIREEMTAFNPDLAQKPQMVLINKIDRLGPERREIEGITASLKRMGLPCLAISALTGEGLEELKETLSRNFMDPIE